jgi:nucleoside-diphosphate-sugar epimerase
MYKTPTLFGHTSNGDIKTWNASVIESEDHSIVKYEFGLEHGKKQVQTKQIDEGKNIGKSNETTHYEQAIKEVESKMKKKMDTGYSEDLADACLYILENIEFNDIKSFNKVTESKFDADGSIEILSKFENRNNHINIGTGTDISIKNLAQMIKEIIGFKGKLIYNLSKPDGTPKKVLNVKRLEKLGWKYKIELKDGISKLYNWYLN